MTHELLTLQEIAKRLDMPPSTVQYYRDNFTEFMPAVKIGRYLKYEAEALEVIKDISEYFKNNETKQEIKNRLSAKYALNIEQTEQGETATTTTTVQQQQHNNNENYKLIAQANKEIYFLRELVQQLQQRNHDLTMQLLQLKAPERKPWWKRIFGQE